MADRDQWLEITMPQLAESLVSATIGKWLKAPGDAVDAYEPICEVITDKVVAEIPATESGIMQELIANEGDTVEVGAVICRMKSHELAAVSQAPAPASSSTANAGEPMSVSLSQDTSMRGRFSPAVQKLAQEHGIDLSQLQGTGLGGRITRKDVLQSIEQGGTSAAPVRSELSRSVPRPAESNIQQSQQAVQSMSSAAMSQVRNSGIHLSETPRLPKIEIESEAHTARGEYLIDVTPIRNSIARNMRQSVSEIPHAWTTIEVDVTNLVQLRNKLKDEFKRKEGINLTYLAFVVKAIVNAIKDYPIMNSVWAVDKIIVKRDINLSLAVGTEDSVLTPVIHKADQKNIAGLAREIEDLARKTREGKLTLNDMTGGTFTVNNTGSFGSILSYPIINYPQAAIVTFESIVKKPVVIDDMIAVRSMANMCLSLDHRILDGVICGRFLQRVKENIESYNLETKLY